MDAIKKNHMMYEEHGVKWRKAQRVTNWLRRKSVRKGLGPKDFIRRHQYNEYPNHGVCAK